MSKQEVIGLVNQLSDTQLIKVSDYIKQIFLQKEPKLDEEQQELLKLLDYTIDSGREDFAEKHDHYLYGKPK
ncbi:hypothetical protein QUF74_13630 [Candidatus Halobeggiatoa sp. HSG11]|nr:hypothetical protein [Candidatus Halobeggiatoa sp. HSG11]